MEREFAFSHAGVCGIYRITNTSNGKFYIGSSVDVRSRIYKHLSHLRLGRHKNAHLQAAYNRDGKSAFKVDLLEECARDEILRREQHYLDALRPAYNVLPVAGNSLGYRHRQETCAKMSAQRIGNTRMLGKRHSEETKRRLSEIAKQRRVDPEKMAKMHRANVGNKHTAGRKLAPDHVAKVSASLNAQWTDGTRSREAAAERARRRWADPAWKAQQLEKIAAAKAAKRAARGLE